MKPSPSLSSLSFSFHTFLLAPPPILGFSSFCSLFLIRSKWSIHIEWISFPLQIWQLRLVAHLHSSYHVKICLPLHSFRFYHIPIHHINVKSFSNRLKVPWVGFFSKPESAKSTKDSQKAIFSVVCPPTPHIPPHKWLSACLWLILYFHDCCLAFGGWLKTAETAYSTFNNRLKWHW